MLKMDKVMLRMGFKMFSGGYDQTVNLCNTGNTAWNIENVQILGNSELAGLVCCQIAFGETQTSNWRMRYIIKKAPESCQNLKITSRSRLSVSHIDILAKYIKLTQDKKRAYLLIIK